MKKLVLSLTVLIGVALIIGVLAVHASAKAQRQSGQFVRLRILKVTEDGVLPHDVQGEPEVIGFSCASNSSGTEPTCYALLRDRVF